MPYEEEDTPQHQPEMPQPDREAFDFEAFQREMQQQIEAERPEQPSAEPEGPPPPVSDEEMERVLIGVFYVVGDFFRRHKDEIELFEQHVQGHEITSQVYGPVFEGLAKEVLELERTRTSRAAGMGTGTRELYHLLLAALGERLTRHAAQSLGAIAAARALLQAGQE